MLYYVLLINSSETRNIKHARIVKLRLGTLQLAAMHLNKVNTLLGPIFSSGCPICFVTAPPQKWTAHSRPKRSHSSGETCFKQDSCWSQQHEQKRLLSFGRAVGRVQLQFVAICSARFESHSSLLNRRASNDIASYQESCPSCHLT